MSVLRLGMGELIQGICRWPASKFRKSNSYHSSIIALGLAEGDAVFGAIGQAHAEAVGLYAAVAVALAAGAARLDERQQAASRVAFDHVGIDTGQQLVVYRLLDLDAVERLAVVTGGLASDGVGDTRGSHQVAFVGGIEEDPPGGRCGPTPS